MRISPALKYQLYDKGKPLAVFYLIIYAIFILLVYVERSTAGEVSFGGMDSASFIFIFVMALTSVKETLMFFLQNGTSRRTFFLTFLVAIAAVALLMSVLDNINTLIFRNFISYRSIYMQIYEPAVYAAGTAVTAVVWNFAFNILTALAGLFIACLYFRMNKWQKIVVSVGVPVFFFIILPIFLSLFPFPDIAVFGYITRFLAFAMGVSVSHPLNAAVSALLTGTLLAFLSFLLLRKTPAKE